MTNWYEVFEDDERGCNTEHSIAFCKFKYTAETVSRYFCKSKIREVNLTIQINEEVEQNEK